MPGPTRFRRTLRLLAATLSLGLAFTGLIVVTAPEEATAAVAPAFDCLEPRFFVQTGSSTNTQLNTGTYLANGDSSWTALGPLQTTDNYNALAFNPVDEFLYGIRLSDKVVVRIDRSGAVASMGGTIAALGAPKSTLWDSGEFDAAGNYYVASGNAGTTQITKIALSGGGAMSTINLTATARFADFSFKDGYLWAHNYGQNNTFYRINVDPALGAVGAVDSYSSAGVLPISSYGSAFTMTNGNLAFVATDNFMYQVSVDTSKATPTFGLVSKVAARPNAYSDATNCSTAADASLTVTKTGPATVIVGEPIAWHIVVSNNGPGISSGFVVKDAFPAGLTDVKVASTDSTCVVNATDIVCNGGRMIAGGTASITVTADAPTVIGSIVNSVRVIGNEDPSPSALATEAATTVTLGTTAGGADTAELVLASADSGASVTQGGHGSVVNNAGTLVYTPEAHFSGVDSFTYTINGSTVTVYVTVVPLAVNDAKTTAINTDATGDVSTNDHASNAQFTVLTDPANGAVTLTTNGTFTYAPNASFTGADSFTYTVSADGGSDSASVTLTVVAAPTAVTDTASTPANTPTVVGVIDNDTGAGISVAFLTDGTHGEAVLNADGTFTYTPDTGFSGSDSFTYTLTGDGGTATGTVNVTVTPVSVGDSVSTEANSAVDIDVTSNDSGSALTIAPLDAPSHGTLALDDDTFTYTPAHGYSGADSFTYTLTGDGGTSTATVSVTVTPVATNDGVSTSANSAISGDVASNDVGWNLSVVKASDPVHGVVVIGSDGRFTYTPDPNFSGTDSFRYTLTGSGGTDFGTVNLTVSPIAVADSSTTLANTTVILDVVANDAGTGLAATLLADGTHGTVTLDSTGTLTYTPDPGFSGSDSFTYTLTGDGGTSTATVSITVKPIATDDTAVTPTNSTLSGNVAANDSGSSRSTAVAASPTHGTLILNSNGVFTYTPAPGFSGSDSFTYTLTADGGEATGTVHLTVTPVAKPDSATAPAGTAVTIDVLANDVGQALSVTGVGNAVNGSVSLSAGIPRFTPTPGFSGSGTFDYALAGAGGTSGARVTITVRPVGIDDSAATDAGVGVTIDVLANDLGSGNVVVSVTQGSHGTVTSTSGVTVYLPEAGYSGPDSYTYSLRDSSGQSAFGTVRVLVRPVAPDDTVATASGGPVLIDVLANDSGTATTVTGYSVPAHGTVTAFAGGALYTPGVGFSGVDTFRYFAMDASGTAFVGTVTVLVAPFVRDDAVSLPASTSASFVPAHNDNGTALAVTGVATPAHGTISISPDGTLTYTPNAGYSGVEILEYRVTDASGQTVTGTVTLTIAPLVMSDGKTVKTGSSATMSLLSNDVGSGLSVTSHTQPGHGTVMVTADGVATYTPTNGFVGTDTFAYTVTDASGQTVTGTVTVNVQLATLAEPTHETADVLPSTGTDPALTAIFAMFLIVSGFLLFLGFPTRRGLHRA